MLFGNNPPRRKRLTENSNIQVRVCNKIAPIQIIGDFWNGIDSLPQLAQNLKEQEHLKKYFDAAEFKTIFRAFEDALAPLVAEITSNDRARVSAAEDKLGNLLQPMKQILSIIVDQPLMTQFLSTDSLVTILKKSKKTDNILLALKLLGLQIEASYKSGSSKAVGPGKISEQTKMEVILQANFMALGFGVFGCEGVELYQVLQKKDNVAEEFTQVYLDSPNTTFDKNVINLNYHKEQIRADFEGFRKTIRDYITSTYSHLSTEQLQIYIGGVEWRARLQLLLFEGRNTIEQIVELILGARRFITKIATVFAFSTLSTIKAAGVTSSPVQSIESLAKILRYPVSSKLQIQVVSTIFDCCLDLEKLAPLANLLLELLADFNRETIRRKSSAREEIGPVIRDSGLLAKVLSKSRTLVGQFGIREESVRDRFDYSETLLTLLDKSIEVSQESVTLLYSPSVYIHGYRLMASDPVLLSQLLIQADHFAYALLTQKNINCQDETGKSPLSPKDKQSILIEVLHCMLSLVNNDLTPGGQTQIQSLMGDFLSLKIWPICFGREPSAPHEVKVLAHKLIVGFFDELPPEYIVQASDRLLTDGVFEGLFLFIGTSTALDVSAFVNTFYLLSRLVHNKKLEQYILETELIQLLFKKLMRKDFFLKSYMKRGKEQVSSQFGSVADAIFEISNSSQLLAGSIENIIPQVLRDVSSLQHSVTQIVHNYIQKKTITTIIEENSPILIYAWDINEKNLTESIALFEEFIQVFMHFFRKFLDVEASSIVVKLVEKQYLEGLLDLFCDFPCLSWSCISDRVNILVEAFISFPALNPAGVQVQNSFLKKACLPKTNLAFQSIKTQLEKLSIQSLLPCLELLHRQSTSTPLHQIAVKSEFSEDGIKFILDFAIITFLCSLSLKCTTNNSPILDSNLINETDLLSLTDIFVRTIVSKVMVPESAILTNLMRETLKAETSDPEPIKDYKEELKQIRSQNPLRKIAATLKNFYASYFMKNNHKVTSLYYMKLGGFSLSDESTKYLEEQNVVDKLTLKLEFTSLASTFFTGQQALTITSLVALYEGGLMNNMEQTYLDIVNLASKAQAILSMAQTGWFTCDEAIIADILTTKLAAFPTETIYILHQNNVESDKFFRGGVECPKNLGAQKARAVRMKLFEGVRNLAVTFLKNESEGKSQSRLQLLSEKSESPSQQSRVKSGPETVEKVDKSASLSLGLFIKSSISFSLRDPFGNDRDGGNPMPPLNRVPRQVINKLVDFGFQEDQIRIAGSRVRNPAEFNEMLDYMLNNPINAEPQRAGMDEESQPSSIQGLIDIPGKDITEAKPELIDLYRKHCQTLLKYFLFLPKNVDFGSLLMNYTNHVNDTSSSGKSSREFIFDLYYLFVDFLLLLKSQVAEDKLKNSLEDFEVNLPSKFNKTKTIGSTRIVIELLPTQLAGIKSGVQRVVSLVNDIEKTLNGLVAILRLAEDQAWTPSCALELKLVYVLYSDLLLFTQSIFNCKEMLVNDIKSKVLHRLRRVFTKCFNFIDQTVQVNQISAKDPSHPLSSLRARPGAIKDLNLKSAMSQKSIEATLVMKKSICQKIVTTTHSMLRLNKQSISKLSVPLVNIDLFAPLVKTLTTCVKMSPEARTSSIESGLLSSILRIPTMLDSGTTVASTALSNSKVDISELLSHFIVSILEDDTLLEKTIESEIKYFFYSLRKRGDLENKSKQEASLSTSKLEITEECLWKEFLQKFSGIASDHSEMFTQVVNRICTVTRKNNPEENKDGSSANPGHRRGRDGGANGNATKNDWVKLSAPIRDVKTKAEISVPTRKTLCILLTEIVITFLREANRCLERAQASQSKATNKTITPEQTIGEGRIPEEKSEDTTSTQKREAYILTSKMLLEVIINKVLSKYPILHLLVLKLDLSKAIKQNCKIPILLSRFQSNEPINFISFMVRAGMWLSPKLSSHIWPFLSHSPVLVYRNRRILPINSIFRNELLKETRAMLNLSGSQLADFLSKGFNSKMVTPEDTMALCLSIRANSEMLVSISQDLIALKALLSQNESSELQIAKGLIECFEQLPIQELSKYKPIMDLMTEPFGLILKYAVQLSLNKSKIDPLLDNQTDTNSPNNRNANSAVTVELLSPESLLLKWISHCKQPGLKKDQALMTAPEVVVSSLDLEAAKREARLGRRGNNGMFGLPGEEELIQRGGGQYTHLWNLVNGQNNVGEERRPPGNNDDSFGGVSDNEGEDREYIEGAEVEEEEGEQYSIHDDRVIEEGEQIMFEEQEEPGMERMATEEESQEIQTYRQETEGTEMYQERLNTLVERESASQKYPNGPKRENPSKRTNIFLIDQHQDNVRAWVETNFPQIFIQFYRLPSTQSLAKGLLEFESFASTPFSQANDRVRGGAGPFTLDGLPAARQLIINDELGNIQNLQGVSHQRLIELLASSEQDRLAQRLFQNFIGRRGLEDVDDLPVEEQRIPNFARDNPYRNQPAEPSLEAVERRVVRGLRVVDSNGAEIAAEPERDLRDQIAMDRESISSSLSRLLERQLVPPQLNRLPSPPRPFLRNAPMDVENLRAPFALQVPQLFMPRDNPIQRSSTPPAPVRSNSEPQPQVAQPQQQQTPQNASPAPVLPAPNNPESPAENSEQRPQDQNTSSSHNPETQEELEEMDEAPPFNFRDMGLPDDFLAIAGIDKEFFDNLPPDMQMEVVVENMNANIEAFSRPRPSAPAPPANPASANANADLNNTPDQNNPRRGSIPDIISENTISAPLLPPSQPAQPSQPTLIATPTQPTNNPENASTSIQPEAGNQQPSLAQSTPQVPANPQPSVQQQAPVPAQPIQPNPPAQPSQPNATSANPVPAPPAPANAAPAPDNEAFLNSLTPDLRREVLMTCPDDFLLGMPQNVVDEARRLRLGSALGRNRYQLDDLPPNMAALLTNMNGLNPRGLLNPGQEPPRRNQKKPMKKKTPVLDPKVSTKLFPISEEAAKGFLNMVCSSNKIEEYPYILLASLTSNPDNEVKICKVFHEHLSLRKRSERMDMESQTSLYNKGLLVKYGTEAHEDTSLNVLMLLEKLTLAHSAYFTQANLNEFMELTKDFKELPKHVELLLRIVLNIVEMGIDSKQTDGSDKVDDRPVEEICRVELSKERVKQLCEVLYFKRVEDETIKALGSLISVLCLNEKNLTNFVTELTNTIFSLCKQLNEQLDNDIMVLKEYLKNPSPASLELVEFSIVKRQTTSGFNESRFLKVFNLILQLYEKSLERAQRLHELNSAQKQSPVSPNASPSLARKSTEDLKSKVCFEVRQQFGELMQNKSLTHLWLNICETLSNLEEIFKNKEKMLIPVITGMKPLIESFFIKYRILCDDEMFDQIVSMMNRGKGKESVKKMTSTQLRMDEEINDEKPTIATVAYDQLRETSLGINELFVLMCEKNRWAINKMISQNIGLLFDSMAVIPKKLPRILDFDNKKHYFKAYLEKGHKPHYNLNLSVRREEIFADSFNQIISKQPFELKGKLHVEFRGEEGEDAGGVAREWFLELSKKIFYPGYCLFIPSASGATYQPSPQSYINKEHIRYFKFIGRVIGKALHDGFLMDAFFTRSFYKHMNDTPLNYEDMEDIDPDYYKNLKWILENDVTDFGIVFSYQADNFGSLEERELIEGGSKIAVTNENKKEYVKLVCYDKMSKTISEQVKAFLDGLHDLIPKDLLRIFDPKELELMLSGLPEIDIDDLRQNTEYHNYTKDSSAIKMFWEILLGFDREMRANFLQFVTGTSKVPIDGFRSLQGIRGIQKFQIHKVFDNNLLPTSHTCMNQLDLPDYPSIDVMREKLIIAVTYGKEGFGFL